MGPVDNAPSALRLSPCPGTPKVATSLHGVSRHAEQTSVRSGQGSCGNVHNLHVGVQFEPCHRHVRHETCQHLPCQYSIRPRAPGRLAFSGEN